MSTSTVTSTSLEKLTQWITESPEKEKNRREIAQKKIGLFVSTCDHTLDFCHLLLSSLPDIWDHPPLRKLKVLHLSDNPLKTMSNYLDNLTNLTYLDLSYNQLENIPESIGNLKVLKILILAHNNLRELQDSLSHATSLTYLNLGHNQLETIPKSIENLTNVEELNLSNNLLRSIPNSIVALTHLKRLNLYQNTTLNSLPPEILLLPFFCSINLKCCSLPEQDLSLLQTLSQISGYTGPIFSTSQESDTTHRLRERKYEHYLAVEADC